MNMSRAPHDSPATRVKAMKDMELQDVLACVWPERRYVDRAKRAVADCLAAAKASEWGAYTLPLSAVGQALSSQLGKVLGGSQTEDVPKLKPMLMADDHFKVYPWESGAFVVTLLVDRLFEKVEAMKEESISEGVCPDMVVAPSEPWFPANRHHVYFQDVCAVLREVWPPEMSAEKYLKNSLAKHMVENSIFSHEESFNYKSLRVQINMAQAGAHLNKVWKSQTQFRGPKPYTLLKDFFNGDPYFVVDVTQYPNFVLRLDLRKIMAIPHRTTDQGSSGGPSTEEVSPTYVRHNLDSYNRISVTDSPTENQIKPTQSSPWEKTGGLVRSSALKGSLMLAIKLRWPYEVEGINHLKRCLAKYMIFEVWWEDDHQVERGANPQTPLAKAGHHALIAWRKKFPYADKPYASLQQLLEVDPCFVLHTRDGAPMNVELNIKLLLDTTTRNKHAYTGLKQWLSLTRSAQEHGAREGHYAAEGDWNADEEYVPSPDRGTPDRTIWQAEVDKQQGASPSRPEVEHSGAAETNGTEETPFGGRGRLAVSHQAEIISEAPPQFTILTSSYAVEYPDMLDHLYSSLMVVVELKSGPTLSGEDQLEPCYLLEVHGPALKERGGTVLRPARTYLIDLLNPSGGSQMMKGLKPILEDPQKLKILHDSRKAARLLFHHYGVSLSGVFDTMIALAWSRLLQMDLLGTGSVGDPTKTSDLGKRSLARVDIPTLLEELGHTHPASASHPTEFQMNPHRWSLRPLTQEMVHSAASEAQLLHTAAMQLLQRVGGAKMIQLFTDVQNNLARLGISDLETPLMDTNLAKGVEFESTWGSELGPATVRKFELVNQGGAMALVPLEEEAEGMDEGMDAGLALGAVMPRHLSVHGVVDVKSCIALLPSRAAAAVDQFLNLYVMSQPMFLLLEMRLDVGKELLLVFASGDCQYVPVNVGIPEAMEHLRMIRAASEGSSRPGNIKTGMDAAANAHMFGPPSPNIWQNAEGGHVAPHVLPLGPQGVQDVFNNNKPLHVAGTLHCIRAVRAQDGAICGITYRVGRSVPGLARIFVDVLLPMRECRPGTGRVGPSMLVLGRPGVGKSTLLRDISRMLSADMGLSVVVVDTTDELAGGAEQPHPAIGTARRLLVADLESQPRVIMEAVRTHGPDVVIIDEIRTLQDVRAVEAVVHQGVMVVAAVNAPTMPIILKNPELAPLLGGVQAAPLQEPSGTGASGTLLRRTSRPLFTCAVEVLGQNRWRLYPHLSQNVDELLQGRISSSSQIRYHDTTGRMVVLCSDVDRVPSAVPEDPDVQHGRINSQGFSGAWLQELVNATMKKAFEKERQHVGMLPG